MHQKAKQAKPPAASTSGSLSLAPSVQPPAINASLRSIVKELPPVAIAVHLANLGNNENYSFNFLPILIT